ncbi:MAG: hypothetical protein ACYC36_03775 [Bellilinea sp.]
MAAKKDRNKNFSASLRQTLSDNYRDKSFSYLDFLGVAQNHGMKGSDVTCALRYLERRSLLYEDGIITRRGGGTPTRKYRVSAGAELVRLPKRKPGEITITPQEAFMLQCFRRLDAWLNKLLVLQKRRTKYVRT